MQETSGKGEAVVSFWKAEEGWGEVILRDGSKCFGHFSVVEQDGYRALNAGDTVMVEWQQAEQDEYSYIAVAIRPA